MTPTTPTTPAPVDIHPIEVESYRILSERVDLSGWPAGPGAVAARVVHATAEPSLLDDLIVPEAAVAAGVAALAAGAPVICDVEMVRAGISAIDAICELRHTVDRGTQDTRTAAAMVSALTAHPDGAVVVVGCAPTALDAVVRAVRSGHARPALVVGVPVGFVGAARAKEDLAELGAVGSVAAISLRGERGGAAIAAAIVNALARMASAASRNDVADRRDGAPARARPPVVGDPPGPLAHPPAPPVVHHTGARHGCLVIGHGTRSVNGAEELQRFAGVVAQARPQIPTAAGYIEFLSPGLAEAIDGLVHAGVTHVTAVPLVLFGAGHMKDDGPAALADARRRHPAVTFSYGREIGVHPTVLSVVAERITEAGAALPGGADAVVVVGRGSSDPDANADLAKVARLLADGRLLTPATDGFPDGARQLAIAPATAPGPGDGPSGAPPHLGVVVPAFVSLARPGVTAALEQCYLLGARRIAVVPYFLFDGLLIDRIRRQVAAWCGQRPGAIAQTGQYMGMDARLVDLVWERYDEAVGGSVHMNCDGCVYRAPLPGYEQRAGAAWFS